MQVKSLVQVTAWVLVVALGLLSGGVALAQERPSLGVLVGTVVAEDDDEDDDEFEFHGPVESLPVGGLVGDWRVGGRTVHVTAATEIDLDGGTVEIGSVVEVEGQPQADGSISATEIERDDGDGDGEDEDDD